MARITVEDCVVKVPNRFDLVVMAAQRSRQISAGEPLTIDRDNDKNPVIALRELADSTIDREELRESVIRGLQRHVEMDEPEDDEMELLMARQALAAGDRDEAEMDRVKQEVAEEMETLQATVDHDRGQPAHAVDEAGSGAGLAAD
ncbi:MAG: DNA-directed RNA polymerase subunit omega [Alphaproteobacteria bacterium]|nr:DNA-directed RNA polymerase subunit omega [Alphaproteobacteria bacterium]